MNNFHSKLLNDCCELDDWIDCIKKELKQNDCNNQIKLKRQLNILEEKLEAIRKSIIKDNICNFRKNKYLNKKIYTIN